jgi:regulatory protein
MKAGRRQPDPKARRAERRAERATLTDAGPVMDAAAGFLAVRPRSIGETRRRLVQLGYPAGLVEAVLAQLVELRYLDDAEFARLWVESRDRARPRGEAALRRELVLKGVAREVIDEVLAGRGSAAAGDADMSAAMALLVRKRSQLEREPDPRRRRQRAYALLARHGFDPDICRLALAHLEEA